MRTALTVSGLAFLTPFGQGQNRNIGRDRAFHSIAEAARARGFGMDEVTMATTEDGRIVETPTEARQAEPGPSVLALLSVSTGLAILILAVVWFVFFRT